MKEFGKYLGLFLAGTAIVAVGIWLGLRLDRVPATGLNQALGGYQTIDGVPTTSASTTPTYLTIGNTATTSIVMDVENADMLQVMIQQTSASGTDATLKWKYYFSNDKIDWYPARTASTSASLTTHSSTEEYHSWDTGTTGQAFLYDTIDDFAAKYYKFVLEGYGTSTTIYAEVNARQSVN